MSALLKLFADRSFVTTFFALVTLIATRVFHASVETTTAIVASVQALCMTADAVLTQQPPANSLPETPMPPPPPTPYIQKPPTP